MGYLILILMLNGDALIEYKVTENSACSRANEISLLKAKAFVFHSDRLFSFCTSNGDCEVTSGVNKFPAKAVKCVFVKERKYTATEESHWRAE